MYVARFFLESSSKFPEKEFELVNENSRVRLSKNISRSLWRKKTDPANALLKVQCQVTGIINYFEGMKKVISYYSFPQNN